MADETQSRERIAALEAMVAERDATIEQLEAELRMVRETTDHGIAIRDEAIEKLKQAIEIQREALAERG